MKKNFTIYIEKEIQDNIKFIAKECSMSLNKFVAHIFEQIIKQIDFEDKDEKKN